MDARLVRPREGVPERLRDEGTAHAGVEERRRRTLPHALNPKVGGVPADRAWRGRRPFSKGTACSHGPRIGRRCAGICRPRRGARACASAVSASGALTRPRHSAPHRVHQRRGARAGFGDRHWPQAGRRACPRRRGRTSTRKWRVITVRPPPNRTSPSCPSLRSS